MKPLVSILIPAFNAENHVAEAIASAVAQSWPHTEVIVVDDGSTDGTLAVASQFTSRGVTVVTQAHGGASVARNRALTLSRGDYIQWLDADDLLGPTKIERQLSALDDSSSARTLLSCSWAAFFSRQSRASFQPTPLWQDLSPVEWLRLKMSHNIFMQTGAWLVSRELTAAAGPWDPDLQVDDDGEYFCRVLLHCDAVRFVPEAQTFYRMSPKTRLSYIGRSQSKMASQFRSDAAAYPLPAIDGGQRRGSLRVRRAPSERPDPFVPGAKRPGAAGGRSCGAVGWHARSAAEAAAEVFVDWTAVRSTPCEAGARLSARDSLVSGPFLGQSPPLVGEVVHLKPGDHLLARQARP